MDGRQDRPQPESPGSADADATDPRLRPVSDSGLAYPPPPYPPPPYPSAGQPYLSQDQPYSSPNQPYPPANQPDQPYPYPGLRPGHPAAGQPPSGGEPYPASWAPAGTPAGVRTLGLAVQIMLGLGLVAGAVRLWAETEQWAMIERWSNPRSIDLAEADASDQFVFAATMVWNLVLVATAVLFVVWFFRLRRNAGLWAPAAQRLGQGAAIWGWLPVVNFWIPFQVAQDALTATKPPGSPDKTGKGALRFWWIMWVAMVVVGFVNRAWGQELDTLAEVRRYTSNSILLTLVSLVAAIAAIGAVRVLTAAQERRRTVTGYPTGPF